MGQTLSKSRGNMEPREFSERKLVRDAVITVAVGLFAVAAIDDITTDSAVSFPLERTALLGCAIWFCVVASRLWRHGHRALGGVSFALVAIAAMMQPWVGQGITPTPLAYFAYFATVGTLAWFLFVAAALAMLAWRPKHRQLTSPSHNR